MLLDLGGHVQRCDHVGLVRQVRARHELSPIQIGILPGRVRELVHEALAVELVGRLPDAATRADRHVERRRVVRVAVVGHVIARRHVERGVGAESAFLHPRAHLERDRRLRPLVRRRPGLRLPGSFDGFEVAVRAILGQQVTVKGASTLAGRFAEALGTPIETPLLST